MFSKYIIDMIERKFCEVCTLFDFFDIFCCFNIPTFSGSSSLIASRNLVEKMGGKIWIESVPYLGTKFFFTIPKSK